MTDSFYLYHSFSVIAALPLSSTNPHGTACNVDILNVQCGQRTGLKAQGAQQYDVGDAPWRDINKIAWSDPKFAPVFSDSTIHWGAFDYQISMIPIFT